ncbi:MAG: hypothetical protein GY850_13500 [bacterium]|nr:hypothetical protein [bacterium]
MVDSTSNQYIIGSWKSLYDFLDKDADNNVLDGEIIARDTRNCFIQSRDRLIATNRLRDIVVVVETPDSIFVSDLEHSRDVKSIVSELKDSGRKEYQGNQSASSGLAGNGSTRCVFWLEVPFCDPTLCYLCKMQSPYTTCARRW